ncbi:hypothetical protein GGR40_004449, partial [Novosphingobium gossypii]
MQRQIEMLGENRRSAWRFSPLGEAMNQKP